MSLELARLKESRERLFGHCINLLAVLAIDLESEIDLGKKKYKKDIYNLTFEAIEIDESEAAIAEVLSERVNMYDQYTLQNHKSSPWRRLIGVFAIGVVIWFMVW